LVERILNVGPESIDLLIDSLAKIAAQDGSDVDEMLAIFSMRYYIFYLFLKTLYNSIKTSKWIIPYLLLNNVLPSHFPQVILLDNEQLALGNTEAFNPSESSIESLMRLIFHKGVFRVFFIYLTLFVFRK